MEIKRKIAIAAKQVKMEDEDQLDVAFWLSRPLAERLAEVCRLRKNYFGGDEGFPQKIEKVFHQIKIDIQP